MKNAIPAAVLVAAATLALSGCAPAASSAPESAATAAAPASSTAPAGVPIEEFLVGQWQCWGSVGDGNDGVQFLGMDSNLTASIEPVVEFESNGIATQYDSPGWKEFDYAGDYRWGYQDGYLNVGKLWAKMPETIPVSATVEVLLRDLDPQEFTGPSSTDAKTEVTFGPNSMKMESAQFDDGHKGTTPAQTITCEK